MQTRNLTLVQCVCIACNFITCVGLCNHNYDQNTELFHHHKISLMLSLYNPSHPLSPPVLTRGDHKSVFQLYNFVILRVLYKRNHTVCNLLRFFSINVMPLIHKVVACLSSFFLFYFSIPQLDVPLYV